MPDIPEITARSAHDAPQGALLLDVREDDEWATGHAPSAVHIPMGSVLDRLGEIDSEGPVHVICRSGGRSGQVTAALRELGVEASNVEGGMQAWAAEGLPVVTDDGRPGGVA